MLQLAACHASPTWCVPFAVRWIAETARKTWQVSSLGRCCDTRGRISLGCLRSCGYYYVMIGKSNWPVHLLVKRTFHGPAPDMFANVVHHWDGASENNRLDNLVYVTQRQNVQYAWIRSDRTTAKPQGAKPVVWRAIGSSEWQTSPSIVEAAKQLGVSNAALSKYCQLNLEMNGYQFAFAADAPPPSLAGEVWHQLIDPQSSEAVTGMLVSSLGRVRHSNGHISEGSRRKTGYSYVQYSFRGLHRGERVHRLIARAFLGPPPTSEHTHVNHKDGIKHNNAANNLEYVTPSENRAHYVANAKESGGKTTCTSAVWSRPLNSDAWQWHDSMRSAALTLGLHASCVSRCARGGQKQTGNHEFRLDRVEVPAILPGEEWCEIDLEALLREREIRQNRKAQMSHAGANLLMPIKKHNN